MSESRDSHKVKMQLRQKMHQDVVASKTKVKGLLMVHTGTGKGKSTAAFGMLFRTLGYGEKCAVIQFIKAPKWQTGERQLAQSFPDLLAWHTMGEGFTWDTQNKEQDILSCEKAWTVAQSYLKKTGIKLVILDELNIALRYNYLSMDQVISDLKNRNPMQHVIITGRNAKQALIEIADMVTEMKLIKHHFQEGIKAQPGIEF